jgi:ABC-2 type transport system ATP-binding protein
MRTDAVAAIEARGLRKSYGATKALDGFDLTLAPGRILGVVGPNGAGKTTALNAILGLTHCEGSLRVLGRDPWAERDALVREASFVADVAVVPRWLKVGQALDYAAGVHPRFDRAKAEAFLARTDVPRGARVGSLSKGMVAQLHLSLVMAIDAKLLVLDEPTLGLDLLYRKRFYETLLDDYFDGQRTIVISTHQVEEVQHVLTDLVFVRRGRVALATSMDAFESRYAEVLAKPEAAAQARALGPIAERAVFGRNLFLFDGADREALDALGEVRTPGIADVFVAVMESSAAGADGGER